MNQREMSFWGWGYADRFPDEAARAALAAQIEVMLGFDGLRPAAPPRLEDLSLPGSRLTPPAALAQFCSASTSDRTSHTYGRGYPDLLRGFRGDFSPAPDLVAYPRDEADVQAVLDWCAREGVVVVPFGGGTSVVGGVERPSGDRRVLSLDLRGLNRVLEVDPVSRAARIQAGATGPQIEAQLQPHGLTLRHYPQSFEFSTLGGWLATRSAGHFATLYTHIDDLVESIRMLTPVGVYASRRLPGSGAGPSPDRLALGSEGILGVITEAWMRVQARPRWKIGASVRFAELSAAVDAARGIAQAGLYPANCRVLDRWEAALHRVTDDGSCVLLLAFESADHEVDAWMERALGICFGCGGIDPDGPVRREGEAPSTGSDAASNWRAAFLDGPYLQSTLVSLGVLADTFETSITWERFPALHRDLVGALREVMARLNGKGVVTCRFTHVYPDGPAPYYTFVTPAKPGGELEQWAEIKRVAGDTLLAHGATITHHHAVGRVHRPWYDRQRPEPFALALRAAKAALDPAGILNPGVLIDP